MGSQHQAAASREGGGAGAPALDVGARGRRGVIAMGTRTLVMRAVSALGTLVLARILLPADFGVYAVLFLVQNTVSSVASFGLGPALIQQRDEPTREQLGTAWILQQLVWVAAAAVIWPLAGVLGAAFPALGPDFAWQLRVMILAIALAMLRALPSAMLVRDLRFREVATIEVAGHVAFYATAIACAVLGAGVWSFVAAILAHGVVTAALSNLAWSRWPGLHFDLAAARGLLAFGIPFQVSNLLNTARDGVVPVFGGLAGGVAAIGLLQFSLRISQLTASLDEIIGRVAFPAFSRLNGEPSRVARLLRDAVLLTGFVLAVPQVWIVATGPWLVPFVFGERWAGAVPALQLMCLGILASIPARIAASLVFGQGRSRIGLIVALTSAGVLVAIFPPLVIEFGVAGGGIAYATAGIVTLALQARAVGPAAPFPWLGLARSYLVAGAAGVVAWLVVLEVGGVVGLAASGIAFLAADLVLAWLFDRADLRHAWRLVRGPAALPLGLSVLLRGRRRAELAPETK